MKKNEAPRRWVTPEAFDARVKVILLPQGDPPPSGHRPGNTLYTLRTHGMSQYNRVELEFADVPALWVEAACCSLNGWALYTINQKEIKEGQALSGGFQHSVLVRAVMVNGVLRFCPEEVRGSCSCCGDAV